ncbi:MAG: ABC transporter substrate-binding protein [Rubellimicrobium sp.]|nr:ABC transporter substrate-binding protein [Rubellimicrobium sp.]
MTITRRSFIAGSAGLGVALSAPGVLRAAASRLALYGPPAAPTVTLAHAVESGMLASFASDISLTVWRTPDELRAGLTSGDIDLSIVPSQVAANMYNRGMGMRLVNVMTDGLLYIMAREGEVNALADLAGRTLAVPFPNDTPDFIARALLDHHGLAGQVTLAAPGTPMEAAQMLLAGRIDAALLTEPVATVVTIRAAAAGDSIIRAIDVQEEWGAVTGLGPVVPQAGLAVTDRFAEAGGDLIADLQAVMEDATAAVIADPEAAAAHASPYMEQPAPMLAASIPHAKLVATPASTARPQLEAMFALMAGGDAAILGGGLPDDGFYAL